MKIDNLFAELPERLTEELFTPLLQKPNFRLERIVSQGQTTPEGEWYDQEQDEWVLLLQGIAELRFTDREEPLFLNPGDHIHIPAHCKHRVEWTSPDESTIWLALHYHADAESHF